MENTKEKWLLKSILHAHVNSWRLRQYAPGLYEYIPGKSLKLKELDTCPYPEAVSNE